MANIQLEHDENKDTLIIKVTNLSRHNGISKTGNSEIIATTHGSINIGEGMKVSLNVYKPVRRK